MQPCITVIYSLAPKQSIVRLLIIDLFLLNASKDKKLEEKALSGLKLDAIKEKLSELNLEINFCQKVNVNLNILQKTYVL